MKLFNGFKNSLLFLMVVTCVLLVYGGQPVLAGYLVAWGNDSNSQCQVPEGNDFVAVAGGYIHSIALKADGTLAAWGWNEFGECDVPADNNFVAVGGGAYYSAALRSDGSLVAWGRNQLGQCDVPAGNDFVAISCGMTHGLALKSDGSLAAWGDNWSGACDVPAGNDFVAIAGGYYYSLALKSDGSLAAWGRNHVGQCDVPAGSNFVAIAAGWIHGLAVRSDGSLAAWGSNVYGQSDVPTGNDFVSVGGGSWHSLALKSDSSLAAWGYNDQGQCDVPGGDDFTAVASGGSHGLALSGLTFPEIDVAPLVYDFGDVQVGTASTTIVTISNVGNGELTVSDVGLQAGSSGDFSITAAPNLPAVIAPGGSALDVEITYSPVAEANSWAVLEIVSDDADESVVEVSLAGVGVIEEPPPEDPIAAILEFFDTSVADETLVGNGPGESGGARLVALRNMIEAAGDVIAAGSLEGGCQQLQRANERTDGFSPPGSPPDFVMGDATEELANMIQDLVTSLGCQ